VRARVAAAGATVRSRLRRAAPVPRPSLEARLRRSQVPGRGVGGAGLAARACAVSLVAARHTGCCDGGRVVRRGASDAWSPSSARCAGSLGSGMQRARGRRVDRRVAIVPFDPVPRRRIAAQDVQHAARSRRPVRGLGLGDDSILDLERHGSFFHLGCTAEANRPPGRPPPRRPPLPGYGAGAPSRSRETSRGCAFRHRARCGGQAAPRAPRRHRRVLAAHCPARIGSADAVIDDLDEHAPVLSHDPDARHRRLATFVRASATR
jgi:hypothetical protein